MISTKDQAATKERAPYLVPPNVQAKSLKITFLSSMGLAWGGSEELWHSAALRLTAQGHDVTVIKTHVEFRHPKIMMLQQMGVDVHDLYEHQATKVGRFLRKLFYHFKPPYKDASIRWLEQRLRRTAPDLVILAQGSNIDGLEFVEICTKLGVRYAIVCQKASDLNWPHDLIRERLRKAFVNAEKAFFVSDHNLELTEMQIGCRLPNAEVVRNPVNVDVRSPLPWPSESREFKLACVARMHAFCKGQDVLLRILAQQKWRQRPLQVTFFGDGEHEQAFQEMAKLLGLENVQFAGFSDNIALEWNYHHALILPSRAEGLPLAVVEAMLCGRPAITTCVGGSAEIIRDNVNGFIAPFPSIESVDDALERAWARRFEWEQIGKRACADALDFLPVDPGEVLARKIQNISLVPSCIRFPQIDHEG